VLGAQLHGKSSCGAANGVGERRARHMTNESVVRGMQSRCLLPTGRQATAAMEVTKGLPGDSAESASWAWPGA
jgi:hypothetical protein